MRQRGFELFSYLPIRGLYHSVLYGGVHEMLKGLFVKKKDPIALKEKKKVSETCVEMSTQTYQYRGPTPPLIIISSPSEWNKQTQEQELLSVPVEERAG